MNRLQRFVANAAILGGVSIFMRIIGVIFNAYAANVVGAEGIGIYSLISSAYVFAVTVATSGINLAVTRLVSEELAKNNAKAAIASVKKCVMYSIIFGSVSAICLFLFARPIGVKLLGDERTVLSLKALSISLPFIALSNVLSGYFNAVKRVSKNASASIAEQFVKIGFTVFFLNLIGPKSVEYACLSLVLGSSIAEGLSFTYLVIFYFYDKKKHLKPQKNEKVPSDLKKRMLNISLPIAASAYLRSGLVTIEHILIPAGLKKYGSNKSAALASYGTIHGMVFPLILFPSAISSTFASLIIPELSEISASKGSKDTKHIKYIVSRAISLSVMFGVICSGAFILFSDSLGKLIYGSEEASKYIGVFAVLIPLMYLDITVDGMLKGLGEQLASMKYNIIDSAISVFLVYTLLPNIGISGYVICVFVTELVNDVLSLNRLVKVTKVKIPIYSTVIAPVISIIGASTVTNLIFKNLPFSFYSLAIETTAGIFTVFIIYIAFLIALRGITREDIIWIIGIFRKKSEKCAVPSKI